MSITDATSVIFIRNRHPYYWNVPSYKSDKNENYIVSKTSLENTGTRRIPLDYAFLLIVDEHNQIHGSRNVLD